MLGLVDLVTIDLVLGAPRKKAAAKGKALAKKPKTRAQGKAR